MRLHSLIRLTLNDFLLLTNKRIRRKKRRNRSRRARTHTHTFIQLSLSDIDYASQYVYMYLSMIVLFHSNIKLCTSNRFYSLGSVWNMCEHRTETLQEGRGGRLFWIYFVLKKEKKRERREEKKTTTAACTTTLHFLAVRQNGINEKKETSASAHIHADKHIAYEAMSAERARIEIKTNRGKETWRTTHRLDRRREKRRRAVYCQQIDDDTVLTNASTQGSRIISHSKSNWHLFETRTLMIDDIDTYVLNEWRWDFIYLNNKFLFFSLSLSLSLSLF